MGLAEPISKSLALKQGSIALSVPSHAFLEELDGDMFLAYAAGGQPTDDVLDQLEGRLNWTLPAEYRQLQRRFGAIYVEAKEEVWPRPEAHQAGPFWTFGYAFTILGAGANLPSWLSLELVAAEFWGDRADLRDLLPISRWILSSGGFVCYDRAGRLIDWRHDEPDERRQLGSGLDQFLVASIKELVGSKNKMKSGLVD